MLGAGGASTKTAAAVAQVPGPEIYTGKWLCGFANGKGARKQANPQQQKARKPHETAWLGHGWAGHGWAPLGSNNIGTMSRRVAAWQRCCPSSLSATLQHATQDAGRPGGIAQPKLTARLPCAWMQDAGRPAIAPSSQLP